MNKLYGSLALLISLFFLSQCQRDLSYVGGPDTGLPVIVNPEPIKASLQGNILDENDQPAASVTVSVGSVTVTTNAAGYFRINDASLDKNTSLVTAEKSGYFKGYRVFSATSGTNQVVIKLIKRNLAGSVSAAAGGIATLPNGARVGLPANGVVDATSGNSYSGEVKIYAAYIDPTAADIAETVPGSFMANDVNGSRVILASYGMLAVELESAAGTKLQIKTGSVATLSAPIPVSLRATAAASIPLWFVDEKTGLWQEEGKASKQGDQYIGEVKHFSNWNYDFRFDAVSLSLTLKNADNAPLVHAKVRITAGEGGGNAYGYSDSAGQVKGLVPANKALVLEVFDPCGKLAYSQNLSPLSRATDLGQVTVESNTPALVKFTGKLTDCNGQAVKKGYAMISFNNSLRYAQTNDNGEYAVSFLTCTSGATTAQVLGVDQNAQQQSAAVTINLTRPTTNAGSISACGTSSVQFIDYTIDGTDYKISSTNTDSIYAFSNAQGNVNFLGAQRVTSSNFINFVVRNPTGVGVFPVGEMGLQRYRSVILKAPFNVTFTSFAKAAGEFYAGTMAGQFTADSSTVVHNLSASFKVRRN